MRSFQQLNASTTSQEPILQQKPAIQAKQKPIQSKQGKKPRHKAKQQPLQRNNKRVTGSGNQLGEYQIKENVSQLMGTDVSDAKVHYNSSKPAQLQAEATAQGTEVHLAPGKEQYLGHELTHVAQQKQGRVQANVQANNGVGMNNDAKLEKEADDVGAEASKGTVNSSKEVSNGTSASLSAAPVQRYVVYGRGDQHNHMSEEDYNTTMMNQQDANPYNDGMKAKYDKQTERFDSAYKKQEAKGKISDRNKKRKEGWRHPQRKTLYVSNDGKMAVENVEKVDPNIGTRSFSVQAWADQSLVDQANQVLASKESYVKLVTEPNDLVVGSVPNTGGPNPSKGSFKKIKAVNAKTNQDMTKSENTEAKAYGIYNAETARIKDNTDLATLKFRDCGKANRLILGCIQEDKRLIARVYKSKDGNITLDTVDPTQTIQNYIKKVMEAEFPTESYSSPKNAYEAYNRLNDTERSRVDEEYGLNVYARPTLGQGVTAVDTNRHEKKMEAEANGTELSDAGFNYHFATNIMQSDDKGDYMALEGLANHEIWYFSMYGTQKGQSFHEQQIGTVGDPQVSAIVDKK